MNRKNKYNHFTKNSHKKNGMEEEMNNNLREQNEQIANVYVARVMRICAIFVLLSYILNVAGIFVIKQSIMTLACGVGILALLIPTFIVKVLKKNDPWVKFVSIIMASIFIFVISSTLNYHIVIIFVFPMALASIYFNPVVNRLALVLAISASIGGRIAAFAFHTIPDANFPAFRNLVFFGLIPNFLLLLALGSIFTALARNTNGLMSSLMDAEEQEKMYEHMKKLTEKSTEVSKGLTEGMKTLTDVTRSTRKANDEISSSTVTVADGIQDSVKQLNIAENNSAEIYESVQELAGESDEITDLFSNVEALSDENKAMMQMVTAGMDKMKESTEICQDAMKQLEEKTKRIDGIVDVIADISQQTDLLSLNAAIESARAGEQGKGFAVVAEEIRKLSQQTQKTLDNVREIITEVLEQNTIAVDAMNLTAEVHDEQKEVIMKAEESAEGVLNATKRMSESIQSISNNTKHIEKSTGGIVDIVNTVTKICRENQESLDIVASAVDTGSHSMRQLEEVVETINGMSDELAVVVQS